MLNERFVGTWKLVSVEARSSNGEVVYPYGIDPFGMLMYDSDGNMSVLITRRDRPKFASDDRQRGTPEETKAAFDSSMSYGGTYRIDEEKGTVTHHLEGSTFPNRVGTDEVRLFKFSNNQLLLITPPTPVGGKKLSLHLLWVRTE